MIPLTNFRKCCMSILFFLLIFIFFIDIFVKCFAGLVCVYKNTRTGLKCLNDNFIFYATQLGEGSFFVQNLIRLIRLESHSTKDNLIFSSSFFYKRQFNIWWGGWIHSWRYKWEVTSNLQRQDENRQSWGYQNSQGPLTWTEENRYTTKPRAIIVKFHWYGYKLTMWKAKRNLKGTKVLT